MASEGPYRLLDSAVALVGGGVLDCWISGGKRVSVFVTMHTASSQWIYPRKTAFSSVLSFIFLSLLNPLCFSMTHRDLGCIYVGGEAQSGKCR